MQENVPISVAWQLLNITGNACPSVYFSLSWFTHKQHLINTLHIKIYIDGCPLI